MAFNACNWQVHVTSSIFELQHKESQRTEDLVHELRFLSLLAEKLNFVVAKDGLLSK